MRALVTGGNGFVGKLLVKKLLNDGISVRLLSRSESKNSLDDVEIVVGDLASNEIDLSDIAIGCDVIFHCAGEVNDHDKMFALHVEGTQRLIDAVGESFKTDRKPKHWVQLSSVGVYGYSRKVSEGRDVTEDSDCKPVGEYEVTKMLSDNLVIEFTNKVGMTYTILRPSNIVGISMPNQSFRRLVSAISKRHFFFIGSKDSISNYIHVDDVVDALILCSVRLAAKNQIFNLSCDCKLKEIVDAVGVANNTKSPSYCIPEFLVRVSVSVISAIISLPLTKTGVDSLVSRTTYSCVKIKKYLDFAPTRLIPKFAAEFSKTLR